MPINDEKRMDMGPYSIACDSCRFQMMPYVNALFSQVFICHMHLKAVRLFVESVLWYGLPVNFQAMVVQVMSAFPCTTPSQIDDMLIA